MNKIDKIAKDSKMLIDSVKDTSAKNLLTAVRSGTISLNEEQLTKVIAVLNLSNEEGYQKALPVFQNAIKKYVL